MFSAVRKTSFRLLLMLFLLNALSAAFADTSVKTAGYRDFTEEEIAEYADEFISKVEGQYHIPYMGFAIIYNGDQSYTRTVGFEDIENEVQTDPGLSRFSIGSSSKIFTYIAVMQLAERGMINLNDDVFSHLDFELKLKYDKPIRIIDLMNHQSGFEDRVYNLKADSLEDIVPLRQWLQDNTPKQVYEPGSYTAYSNYGISLLGQLVASVTGQGFEDYIRENIHEVLGMENSTYEQNITEHLVKGYRYDAGSASFILQDYEYWNIPPAGSMRTTPDDMAKLCVAMLNNGSFNGKSLMSRESMELFTETSWSPGKGLNGLAHGMMEYNYNGYDYLAHGGTTSYQHSSFSWFQELGIGFYITGGCDDARSANAHFAGDFIDRFYEPIIEPAEYVESIDVSRYAGTYYMARSTYSSFEKIVRWGNSLTLRADGDQLILSGDILLKPVTDRYFRSEDGNARILFDLDGKGRVVGFSYSGAPITYYFKQHGLSQNMIQFLILGAMVLALIATGIIRLIKLGIRKCRKREKDMAESAKRRFSNLLAVYIILTVLTLAGFFVTIDLVALLKGQIGLVRILSGLFMLLIPLTGYQVVRTIRFFRDAGSSVSFRIAEAVVSLCSAGIVAWLLYWNLVGIPYLF